MNVTIVTPLRDEMPRLLRYRWQIYWLDWEPSALRLVLCEGDSQDDTARWVHQWAENDARIAVVHCQTGRPRYGSVVHPERFALLAEVFNTALNAVDYAWSDYVLMLPADITYGADLLWRLTRHSVDSVAPLVFMDDVFYDTWAFTRHGGAQLPPFRREHTASWFPGLQLAPMDTVGGVTLFKRDVLAAGARYTPENVDRGLCEQARKLGFGVWCDPAIHVTHETHERMK